MESLSCSCEGQKPFISKLAVARRLLRESSLREEQGFNTLPITPGIPEILIAVLAFITGRSVSELIKMVRDIRANVRLIKWI